MTTSSSAAEQDVFSSASALWSNVSAWSLGGAPVATQDAFIGAGATGAAAATTTASVTVNSIAVNAASTLNIDAGTFTATDGSTLAADDAASLGVGNAGLINVSFGGTLALGGAFLNEGGVEIARANLGDAGALHLIGDVTLTGGGRIDLGIQQGAAATSAPISGDGLVNVDNVISGAGVISLATLDNRAGGVISANQSTDDDLTLDIAQMSNEGQFRILAGAYMELGHDGQSRSLANSGVIAVGYGSAGRGANANLMIAGNFTISGSGAIDLVGMSLVSSDHTLATFTNAGSILATSSSQIGDGGQDFHDLTFVNSGSVVASGAGVTLTLYTPGFVIADSGLLQAANGASLVLGSETDLSGAGAVIQAGAGGTVQIVAHVVDEGGAGGVVVEAGGTMTLSSGAAVPAVTIDGASGATAGGALTVQVGAAITGAITFASAGATLNLVNQSAPLTVTGDHGFVTLQKASVIAMGSGETISTLGSTGNYAILGGSDDTLMGSNASFTMLEGASATLTGSNNNLFMGAGALLSLTGTGERLIGAGLTVTAASGADFLIGDAAMRGATDAVSASNAAIRVGAYGDVDITGDDDTVAARPNSVVNINGAGMNVHFGSNATGSVGGNGTDGDVDTIRGASFSASVLADSNVKLGTLGANIKVGDNADVLVNRRDNLVTAGAADTIDVWGFDDQIVLGTNDVINDHGTGNVFTVGGGVGASSISGFGWDATAQLDLTNGVGGFATANDAYAALTGDGAGGLELALGAAGTIDFSGASASMLTAANFKIG